MRAALHIAAFLALTACSGDGEGIAGEPIACAIGPAAALALDCGLERDSSGDSDRFVVHHPDGGFRRIELAPDARGLVPADGADDARNRVSRNMIELSIGQDRYRIPAYMVRHDGQP